MNFFKSPFVISISVYAAAFMLLLLGQSCETANREGIYEKRSGSGGRFHNDELYISKRGDDRYVVRGLKNGIPEWATLAKVDEDSQLYWSEGTIPVKISFGSNKAKLYYGNGAFGEFKFEKTSAGSEDGSINIQELNYFNDKDGSMRPDLTKLYITYILGFSPAESNEEYSTWILHDSLELSGSFYDNKLYRLSFNGSGEVTYSGLPYNLLINKDGFQDVNQKMSQFKPNIKPVMNWDGELDETLGYNTYMQIGKTWIYLWFDTNKILRTVSYSEYDPSNVS